ncbi:hypothetical protein [Rhodococcus sp. O3]|uniref:hypothetical protein n=1 Tax=Rhodococcus sp. O3 TaxID=3404919 RepID=UPI003B675061
MSTTTSDDSVASPSEGLHAAAARSYNVVAEIDVSADEETTDPLRGTLADHNGAAGHSELMPP